VVVAPCTVALCVLRLPTAPYRRLLHLSGTVCQPESVFGHRRHPCTFSALQTESRTNFLPGLSVVPTRNVSLHTDCCYVNLLLLLCVHAVLELMPRCSSSSSSSSLSWFNKRRRTHQMQTWWRRVYSRTVPCVWDRRPWRHDWSRAGWRRNATWRESAAGCSSPFCRLPAFRSPRRYPPWRNPLENRSTIPNHHTVHPVAKDLYRL